MTEGLPQRPTVAGHPGVLVRWRWLVLASFAAACVWGERHLGTDWPIVAMADGLLRGPHPLDAYVQAPQVQIGPPALLLALPETLLPHARLAGEVVIAGLGLLALWLLEGLIRDLGRTRPPVELLLVGTLVMAGWSFVVTSGHVDDALALTSLCLALRGVTTRCPVVVALALALAVGAKPWAVVGVPLMLAFSWREQRRAWVILAAGVAACWLPFVVAHPETVSALGGFRLGIGPGASAYDLGLRFSPIPGWYRAAQLGGGAVAAAVAVRRGRWDVALLLGLTVRVLLDPGHAAYYGVEVVLGAAVLDLLSDRLVPVLSALAVLTLVAPSGLAAEPSLVADVGLVRCVGCLLLLAFAAITVVPRGSRPSLRVAVPA